MKFDGNSTAFPEDDLASFSSWKAVNFLSLLVGRE